MPAFFYAHMKQDREEALTLQILEAIEARSELTQRHLADRMGVALGLANSFLRRCVRKGLVKITQAPANRYLYYLTPQGLAEKSRLTAQYLNASFDFYRRAGASMGEALRACEAGGVQKLLFAGVSELADIAYARSHDFTLQVIGTYAPGCERSTYLGRPVWSAALPAEPFDAVMITALEDCAGLYRSLAASVGPARIVVPDLLAAFIPGDEAPRDG